MVGPAANMDCEFFDGVVHGCDGRFVLFVVCVEHGLPKITHEAPGAGVDIEYDNGFDK